MNHKKELNVAVDLDGVVANFSLKFSELCRKIFGNHLPLVDNDSMILHWDWDKWYPLTKEEISKVWKHLMSEEIDFWESLPILNRNGWESIKELQYYDHINVYFITARATSPGKTVAKQSINWLEKNGWNNPQVIVTVNKEHFIKHLDIKFFVDDKKENCESAKKENPNCKVYVFDTNYNRHLDAEKNNIKRIVSLNEFLVDILNYA